jgi:hypothetical protein
MSAVPNDLDARLAASVVRIWTHVYTYGMRDDIVERRCAEIESDLWEFTHDAGNDGLSGSLQILARLAVGAPEDVAWRLDHGTIDDIRMFARLVTLAALAAVLSLFWTVQSDGARMASCVSAQNPRQSSAERVMRCVNAFFGGPSDSSRNPTNEYRFAGRRVDVGTAITPAARTRPRDTHGRMDGAFRRVRETLW